MLNAVSVRFVKSIPKFSPKSCFSEDAENEDESKQSKCRSLSMQWLSDRYVHYSLTVKNKDELFKISPTLSFNKSCSFEALKESNNSFLFVF